MEILFPISGALIGAILFFGIERLIFGPYKEN
jgi:hypothetical protein